MLMLYLQTYTLLFYIK